MNSQLDERNFRESVFINESNGVVRQQPERANTTHRWATFGFHIDVFYNFRFHRSSSISSVFISR